MGYRCTWVAVRGGSRVKVLPQLGFTKQGQSDELVYDPGLYGIELPAGWYVAMGDGWDYVNHLNEGHAAAVSGEAMFFHTDDTSMTTRLAAYQQGHLVWGISYDGSNGIGEPDIAGTPPACVADTLAKVRGEQEATGGRTADVDHIYELTAEVGRILVGFRHDETLADEGVTSIDILALQH